MKKKEKQKGLDIWQVGSFPQNLAWIHVALSDKPELTDGWTTDACATTVALLTKSSRAKNETIIIQQWTTFKNRKQVWRHVGCSNLSSIL